MSCSRWRAKVRGSAGIIKSVFPVVVFLRRHRRGRALSSRYFSLEQQHQEDSGGSSREKLPRSELTPNKRVVPPCQGVQPKGHSRNKASANAFSTKFQQKCPGNAEVSSPTGNLQMKASTLQGRQAGNTLAWGLGP